MITCEEFADQISDYLDGRVPMGSRVGIWMHAMLCTPCRRYLAQMKRVVELMGEIPQTEATEGPDEARREELMERFRKKHSGDGDSSDS